MQKTILVIDDDQALLNFYCTVLQDRGRTLGALDMAQARKLVSSESIDLIILDFYLAGDTEKFQDIVAELKPVAPILLCSGVQDVHVPVLGLSLGIAGYWNKSSDRSRLLDLVDAALQ